MYVCTSPGSKKGGSEQGRRKVDNWGGVRYSYIHFLHHLFPLKAIVFTVCEHEYMNICPPPIIDFPASLVPMQLNFIQWTQNCLASRNSNKTKQTKTMTKRSQHSFVKTLWIFIRIPSLCNIIKASFKNSSVPMQTRKTVDVVATFP
jgi:hypothetical protein